MRNIREYAEKYSEANLQQLARTDHRVLGSALLYRQTYREILQMAETDLSRADRALRAFQTDPSKYLEQRYPEPFTSIDREMRKLVGEYQRTHTRKAA